MDANEALARTIATIQALPYISQSVKQQYIDLLNDQAQLIHELDEVQKESQALGPLPATRNNQTRILTCLQEIIRE